MKKFNQFIFLCLSFAALSQNVQVSSSAYTPQELIENVLINSACIENLVVTNVVGGDFNSTEKSYGYFDANGSSLVQQTMYLIHLLDWFSLLKAEKKGVDVIEVEIIDFLKSELAKN